MNPDQEAFALAVESWLEASPAPEDPDAVLDRVVARLDETRQLRRSQIVWRTAARAAQAAAATAAAIAIAFLAYQQVATPLLGRPNPSPTLPMASPSQTPGVDGLQQFPETETLAAGTYSIPPLRLTVDDGWTRHVCCGQPAETSKEGVGTITVRTAFEVETGEHADETGAVCDGTYVPGPFVEATVQNVVDFEWAKTDGTIADVVVDGRQGKMLVERTRPGAGLDPCYGRGGDLPLDGSGLGEVTTSTIAVEADGGVVFIRSASWADADPAVLQELQAVIDSIRFDTRSGLTSTPRPAPTPRALEGPLGIGERTFGESGPAPRFSLGVPSSGWVAAQDRIYKDVGGEPPKVATFRVGQPPPDAIYPDPCNHTLMEPPSVGSAAGLAAATAAISGIQVIDGPSDVVVDGHPGSAVTVRLPQDFACGEADYWLWHVAGREVGVGGPAGATIRAWFVDVDGELFWFVATANPGIGPWVTGEMDWIVKTIEFE